MAVQHQDSAAGAKDAWRMHWVLPAADLER